MQKIKLLIFDLDGTLSNSNQEKIREQVRRNAAEFLRINKLSTCGLSPSEMLRKIDAEYSKNISFALESWFGIDRDAYFKEAWNLEPLTQFVEKNERLRESLLNLRRDSDIKIALLTNAPEVWARKQLSYQNISDLFDGVWFGDGDVRKPQKEAYFQVLRKFSTEPKNTIMVDDDAKDVDIVKGFGITMALIAADRTTKTNADFVCQNIYDFLGLINKQPTRR